MIEVEPTIRALLRETAVNWADSVDSYSLPNEFRYNPSSSEVFSTVNTVSRVASAWISGTTSNPGTARARRPARRRTPRSASTFRAWEPYPIVVDRADGPYLWDVDGNRYVDFDMNNGAGMVGHNNPVVTDAVRDQLERGTLYTHPHELLGEAARAIKDRWGAIDRVRFTNIGTEATMHAIRVARAYAGRDKLLKIDESYHGAHNYVLVSKAAPRGKLGRTTATCSCSAR